MMRQTEKSASASQPVAKIFERNEIHTRIKCINIEWGVFRV